MAIHITDYFVERMNEPKWYRLKIYEGLQEKVYGMLLHNEMLIQDGRITSISGNGCSRKSFSDAKIELYPFRAFDKGKEKETLEGLMDLVCTN